MGRVLTIPEDTGRISKSSCTPSLSRTSASTDLTTNASIDPLAANAILALGNQFCTACPAASADALLAAPSTQFAIGGFCPRGTSAAGDLSFLPGSHCCVATEDHRDALRAQGWKRSSCIFQMTNCSWVVKSVKSLWSQRWD